MNMRYMIAITMFCIVILSMACNSSAAQIDASKPLQLSIDAPSTVKPRERAQLSLHVRNVASGPLTVVSGVPPQEFVITNPAGDEIWSSLATAACPNGSPWAMDREDCIIDNGFRVGAGHEWTFGPGEEKVLTETWDGTTSRTIPVQPGDYTLTGLVELEDGQISSQPVTIVVLP